jgi:hypothetical protein
MRVGNNKAAHSLFMRNIAPLYFMLPCLGQKNAINKLNEARSQFNEKLLKFRDSRDITDFSSQGQLIYRFLEVIKQYDPSKDPQDWIKMDAVKQITNELSSINSAPSDSLLLIKRCIWEFLVRWNKELKLQGMQNTYDELATLYMESP